MPYAVSGAVDRAYLSPRQLASRLEVCPDTVRKWRLRGAGPRFCRFGNRYRYRLEDVQAFERTFTTVDEVEAVRCPKLETSGSALAA